MSNENSENSRPVQSSEPARPPMIGILYEDESGRGLTHPFFNPILNAIREEAAAQGYDICLINHRDSYLDSCRTMDGVCLVCVDFASPAIIELVKSDIPCVTVDHLYKGVPAVLSDNETGVSRLVDYAVSRGHRRIAFIHGHNNSIVTRSRITQFTSTMSYHKLPVPPEYIREGRYHDIVLTRELVSKLLTLPERPTCILLPDDISYLGALEAARDLDLTIPGDISFAGYDGIALMQRMRPQLTTILQDCEKIGKTAVRLLVDRIHNPAAVRRMPAIFPVTFLEGSTVSELG